MPRRSIYLAKVSFSSILIFVPKMKRRARQLRLDAADALLPTLFRRNRRTNYDKNSFMRDVAASREVAR